MEEIEMPESRIVKGVNMGFFCQSKMVEVNLTLNVAIEIIETEGGTFRDIKRLKRRLWDHQDESCGGCREIEKIKTKLEFYDL